MSLDSLGELKDINIERVRLCRDVSGSLRLVIEGEQEEFYVVPFICFPFTGQDEYISLMRKTAEGAVEEEILLIFDYRRLDAQSRSLIEEELKKSAYTLILKVYAIAQKKTSLEWDIQAGGHRQTIESMNQQDVFQIGQSLIVINAVNGRKYVLKISQLDRKSRTLVGAYV